MKHVYLQRIFFFLLLSMLPAGLAMTEAGNTSALPYSLELYMSMQLQDRVSYSAFEQALCGYTRIDHRKDIITLIDFTKPSTVERLFVLDLDQHKLLFSSHVSHGRNSGANYAVSFSNEMGSYKSSLGFYLTEGTYIGKNGYSLILDGLEKGINDRARERAIVIHGASYSNPSVISSGGRLGRSQGCPALPEAISRQIIDTIKGGSLLFIYANDAGYQQKSVFTQSQV